MEKKKKKTKQKGDYDVYSESRESLARQISRDERLLERQAGQWEYKWKESDTELHGPFTMDQLREWNSNNYFENGIIMRKIGTKNWISSKDVDFK